ncbi:MAG: GNAT family N-acetyltransferase [Granulosicoccus sp.]|nr:GNAT family N-acetyltransferase [Granulosicoccus sp.]
MKNLTISVDDQTVATLIEGKLLDSLRVELPQSRNENVVLSARDGQQSLIGGLTGSTSYGWLLIKTLWVDSPSRRCGIGSALLLAAEERAVQMGCHAAWLDTSNPQAMQFYQRHGFLTFGSLANEPGQFPASHQRWFMKKSIRQ